MCGIYVNVHDIRVARSPESLEAEAELRKACADRGPDARSLRSIQRGHIQADFYAAELCLRGSDPVVQPHVDSQENILCWNGEVFGGMDVNLNENDGIRMLSLLGAQDSSMDLVRALAGIEGPYAMTYYQASSGRLFVARDCLGRRSLLFNAPSIDGALVYTSVSSKTASFSSISELETPSIHCIDLESWGNDEEGVSTFGTHLTLLDRDIPGTPYALPGKVNQALPPAGLAPIITLEDEPEHMKSAINAFIVCLERSVASRVCNIPSRGAQSRLAILFSGGIDCTALAYFAHNHLPLNEPIDLLNVAFENPRKARAAAGQDGKGKKRGNKIDISIDQTPNYMVPDRKNGLDELEELRKVCPGRPWNFVSVDVPFEECQAAQPLVEALMWPRNTNMDLSLANALYFASRGQGTLTQDGESVSYNSSAKVLLSGLGSDELLGGYGRHRTTFKWGSWPALIQELQTEIDRIPVRNLGRDDRVISSHGKECRHPFLSLDVVNFLAELPVHLKVDPIAAPGVGDKVLLRLSMRRLGLVKASMRLKKAMQFGSQSARMHGGAADSKGDIVLR